MTLPRLHLAVRSLLASALAATTVASAQSPSAGRETSAASVASYRLSQQMPVDPEVVVGTLPNGLRYYVRANGKPAPPGRAAAGRQGRFGAGRRRPAGARALRRTHGVRGHTALSRGRASADFLSSLGLSIGPDANAATSYDDTQYTLRVPTDVPGVLDRALLVLEDWAQGASFDQGGIDRERGIVLSEWRMHLGAGERTQDKIRRVQLEGSRYADRPPDRQSRHHRARAARAADAVLPRLVPPGSDGGDCRRRCRSRRRRRR